MQSASTINIAEKRMRDLVGHFADVTRRTCRSGQTHGLKFHVYYSSSADEALGSFLAAPNVKLHTTLRPLTLSTWEKAVAVPFGRENYKRWKKKLFPASREAFAAELFNAPLFLPTADVSDLLGILRHQRKHNCLLGFWYSPDMEFAGATERLLKALSTSDTKNLQVGAYDDETLNDLKVFEKHVEILRLPCPYDQEANDVGVPKRKKTTVGFFGFMGRERGGQIKQEIKRLCIAAGFEVFDESSTDRNASKSGKGPSTYVTALGQSMANCDIIVWPSDGEAYAKRTSGIVFQSIANGLPIIVPQKSRPTTILQQANHPHETFSRQEPDAIVAAIVKVAKQIESTKSLAQTSSKNFNAKEGSIALVKCLYRHMLT